MPNDRRLLTIVQISDLHFGDLTASGDDADLDAAAEAWWQLNSIFDGYLGHSGDALRHLNARFAQLRDDEHAMLVISGDLTAVGSDTQFGLARSYLERTITLSTGHQIGLGVSNVLAYTAVPGNHDHWPGTRATFPRSLVMFGASKHVGTVFPTLPVVPPAPLRLPLTKKCFLSLAGIDGDADVHAFGPGRFWGRGHFVSALSRLNGLYSTAAQDEVRVLLLHHSPQNNSFTLGLTDRSRQALAQFIRQNEVSVILTGHMHVARGKVYGERRGGTRWDVLEGRCGTTTQRDTTPQGWSNPPRPLDPNTLLVHRLWEVDDGRIIWRPNLFLRSDAGFEDKGPLRLEGRMPGDEGVVVWPRV